MFRFFLCLKEFRVGVRVPGFGDRPLTPDPGTCRQVPPSQERWAPFPTGVYGADLLAPDTLLAQHLAWKGNPLRPQTTSSKLYPSPLI